MILGGTVVGSKPGELEWNSNILRAGRGSECNVQTLHFLMSSSSFFPSDSHWPPQHLPTLPPSLCPSLPSSLNLQDHEVLVASYNLRDKASSLLELQTREDIWVSAVSAPDPEIQQHAPTIHMLPEPDKATPGLASGPDTIITTQPCQSGEILTLTPSVTMSHDFFHI